MPKNQSGDKLSDAAVDMVALRDKIYIIRGQKVMLDYDLAKIYGYTTSAFNQQVARNKEKFEGEDFMFRLNNDDMSALRTVAMDSVLISQNVIAIRANGKRGGRSVLPYAFTEQGVYMLMTVLHGKLAVEQSRTLIRMFKVLKDYIVEGQEMLNYRENLQLAMHMIEHSSHIANMKNGLGKIHNEIARINLNIKNIDEKLKNTVTKSEISPLILDFHNAVEQKEYVILNGQPMKASELYVKIYAQAKYNVYIIDNYVSVKTLWHLKNIKPHIKITIFSDDVGKYLRKIDYLDFRKECPRIKINFVKTNRNFHDRFIIIDYGAENEMIYHCGGSEKDAGSKITVISKLDGKTAHEAIHKLIDTMAHSVKPLPLA